MHGVTTRMVALLALALIVLGCSEPVQLLTGDARSGAGGCPKVFASGPLVVHEQYGTAIVNPGGGATVVAWRPGFSAQRFGSEVRVSDPNGKVVATTGRSYKIVGAYLNSVTASLTSLNLPEGGQLVFWTCGVPQPVEE